MLSSCILAKLSNRWLPGVSLEDSTSFELLVAETTMKYSGKTEASEATTRKTYLGT